jgi:thiol peroxidase
LQVTVNNQIVKLQQKDRKIDSEAPAIKLRMSDNEDKVIGMMAENVQVFITLFSFDKLTKELEDLILNYSQKANIYVICNKLSAHNLYNGFVSDDFLNISKKMGVCINDESCANSIFIINKDGLIKYKNILPTVEENFDLENFKKNLNEVINFKKKGHTHENWMSV